MKIKPWERKKKFFFFLVLEWHEYIYWNFLKKRNFWQSDKNLNGIINQTLLLLLFFIISWNNRKRNITPVGCQVIFLLVKKAKIRNCLLYLLIFATFLLYKYSRKNLNLIRVKLIFELIYRLPHKSLMTGANLVFCIYLFFY